MYNDEKFVFQGSRAILINSWLNNSTRQSNQTLICRTLTVDNFSFEQSFLSSNHSRDLRNVNTDNSLKAGKKLQITKFVQKSCDENI